MFKIECVVKSRSQLGEGAMWDMRTGQLWWVDISAGLIHCFDPKSKVNKVHEFGEPVGCLALRESGGLIVAAKSGFYFFDPITETKDLLVDPEVDRPGNRFNDGTTDMQGRFWAGTMKDGGDPEPTGRFYRLDPNLSCRPWLENIYTTNGLAFSGDGKTMYFSDSHPKVRTIWTCDYDTDTGTPSNRRVFYDTRTLRGRPDGGTVDADGCYWMAGVGGWHVVRFTPDGRVDLEIDMPVEKPTKPMFGGAGLDELYVTSIGAGTLETPDPEQPDAGGLFVITGLGITGVPQARFRG